MNREQAKALIRNVFENKFNKDTFVVFIKNLLNEIEEKRFIYQGNYIPDAFKPYITSLERIGKYNDGESEIDILIVKLQRKSSLERARTRQRNFIAWYLKGSRGGKLKDAALVAFVSPDEENWRFSLVKMDYRFEKTSSGQVRVREEFTPPRRWSFLVGKNEKSHTAQSQLIPLLMDDEHKPTLSQLENTFSIEKVTDEFFEAYKFALYNVLIPALNNSDVPYNKKHSFAQQFLSRILFIYFLQRKGWFKWKNYVKDTEYIKNYWLNYKKLLEIGKTRKNSFYSEWLNSLFFGAFNKKSQLISPNLPDDIKESLKLMPFLNGGLFSKNQLDELGFDLPDSVFEWLFEPDELLPNKNKGFLEIFNFTINEASPLDIDVAVDPEMLGKVYESLIAEEERGSAGIFYTPRVEIDFMCRISLVEYLAQTNIPKEKIIKFIFDPRNNIRELTLEQAGMIKTKLYDARIVDPAVGSASFLVGMMNVLVELHSELTQYLENREENLFSLKQRIILENLYGVDVKDWAVMVGELRLWLTLIIETDEKFMDIYTKPLLPNLSFKIRQGDSLVQEIAGLPINLRNDISGIPLSIKAKLRELIDRKTAFFSGQRSADLKELNEIENFEQEIFKEIIKKRAEQIKRERTELIIERNGLQKPNKKLFTETEEIDTQLLKKLNNEIEQKEKELNKYETLLSDLGEKATKDYFLWELDFVEIFSLNNGFDIVIGNPPYVRQELIAPPLEHKQDYRDNTWRALKTEYKNKLIKAVKTLWEDNSYKLKVDKKSDLYVYFYYKSLSLLKPNGIFCFINSNSWLDVGYGAGLQEFLLKRMQPLYIIDNIAKRSFKQADVNTVIVLIKRPKSKINNFTLKFVVFKKPFENVIGVQTLLKIESASKPIFDDDNFRLYPKTKKELLAEAVDMPKEGTTLDLEKCIEYFPYRGNKWGGKYLRAPEIYFKILAKGRKYKVFEFLNEKVIVEDITDFIEN